MTRFDDVARLRELEKKAEPAPWAIKTPEHNDGYQEAWIVGPDKTGVMPVFNDMDDHLNVAMRNAAPWLLEAAACFQSGDDTKIQRFLDNAELIYKQDYASDLSEIEFREFKEVLIRLQKAAAIMEDLE